MNMEIKSSNQPVAVANTGIARTQSPASAKPSEVSFIKENPQASTDKQSNVVGLAAEVPQTEKPEKEVEKAVTELNSSIQNVQRNLQFSMDKELGKIIINVKDKETDEVVRQFPSEEFLDLARKMKSIYDSKNSVSSSADSSIFFSSSA